MKKVLPFIYFFIFFFLPVTLAEAQSEGEVIKVEKIDAFLWSIIKTIQWYTLPLMAIALVGIGLKLVLSGDDNSSKEQAKSWLIRILIGGTLIFGAATIAGVLKNTLT